MRKIAISIVCVMLVGTFVVVTQDTVGAPQDPDYTYIIDINGDAIITGYTGVGGNITIPSTLDGHRTVTIWDSAFDSVNGHLITSVIIPDSVTSIKNFAFNNCTLMESATIGINVTNIGQFVFQYCSNLISITLLMHDPPAVCGCWVDYTSDALRGHAYTDSHFPPPGEVWADGKLMMGAYIVEQHSPVFETPTPVNGSTNNPLSFSWSILINDPDGDQFSWTIKCSNGQVNSTTGAANGPKSLSLSGLAYSTTYKIWVNATDPTGSDQYTRKWYTFTTKVNNTPVFGTPSPANGSTGNPLSLTWSIPINDPEGDQFSWTIQCSNGQVNNGTGVTNGIKALSLSGLTNSTIYKVWVNATDPTPTGSGLYTRKWYTFTTKSSRGDNETPNSSPTANFSYSPSNPKLNDTIQFTDTSSDSDGTITSWSWDFGDGIKSTTNNPQHKYSANGVYTVTLEVTDNDGAKKSTSKTITVIINNPPNPPLKPIGQTSIERGVNYTFNSSAIDPDGDQVRLRCDWGDGSFSNWSEFVDSNTIVSLSHSWSAPSIYSIRVITQDNNGLNSSWSTPLTVTVLEPEMSNETPILNEPKTPWFTFIFLIGAIIAIVVLCGIMLALLWKKRYF